MNFEVKVLETEEEFLQLIPLVVEFVNRAGLNLMQSFYEVCDCFKNPYSITIIAKVDNRVTGYMTGTFISKTEFFGLQLYSNTPETNLRSMEFIRKTLLTMGCERIMMHTKLDPKLFEKYGFKFDRFLLIQDIKKEE